MNILLNRLCETQGSVTVHEGVLTFPDGTTIPLPLNDQPPLPTTQKTTPKPERYCVVDGAYLLPFDKAFELMTLLAEAQRVTTDYSGGFRAAPTAEAALKCVMLPHATYAALQLDRTD